MKRTIIDIKRFGECLIVSYKGEWGISFQKIRLDGGEDEKLCKDEKYNLSLL